MPVCFNEKNNLLIHNFIKILYVLQATQNRLDAAQNQTDGVITRAVKDAKVKIRPS